MLQQKIFLFKLKISIKMIKKYFFIIQTSDKLNEILNKNKILI